MDVWKVHSTLGCPLFTKFAKAERLESLPGMLWMIGLLAVIVSGFIA